MQLYLAAAPDRLAEVQPYHKPIAHAAYRIASDAHLASLPLPPQLRGGLMLLSDRGGASISQPEGLCREIAMECRRRGFGGAVLDFEGEPTSQSVRFVRVLEEVFARQRRQLFVTERWGVYTRHAAVLICSAISGGTLRQRLAEARERFSPRPLALDCQRLAMDFLLPSPNGEGAPLTQEQLTSLRQGRTAYFSEDLCARYFTYRTQSRTHFVLFDDADTLRRKLALAEESGISAAFFMLPEVADLAEELFKP